MNTNNGKTGNVNIPGALHSTGGDGDGQIGGVVAYAGDVYDENLNANQAEINKSTIKLNEYNKVNVSYPTSKQKEGSILCNLVKNDEKILQDHSAWGSEFADYVRNHNIYIGTNFGNTGIKEEDFTGYIRGEEIENVMNSDDKSTIVKCFSSASDYWIVETESELIAEDNLYASRGTYTQRYITTPFSLQADGNLFIKGVGGFDGTNSDTAKPLQETLNEKADSATVSTALNDLNNNVSSKLSLDSNNNLIINPKSEVESTATDSLIGGIATVGKGAYAFGFGGNALSVYISGNTSDGYQLQANTTSAFDPTNQIRSLFESIYKNTYLLNADTYEKVAKITAVTPNTDGQKISITLDTDLGTLTNALYRLENISKNKSFNFGVFGNTGDWSSILGYGSYNTGNYSNLLGSNNYNSKTYSTLLGTLNINNGKYSTLTGYKNANTGNYSILIGYNNKATAGDYPCAIGAENTLNAYGYAIGWKNIIDSNNKNGYLIGFDNYANTTTTAFLLGQKLVCENSRGGFYIGQYNKEYISNDASIANWFAVGCGKDSSRENAIEVKQNGNIYIYDVGGFTGANSNQSNVKPLNTVISELQTSSTNNDTIINDHFTDNNSIKIGTAINVSGTDSIAGGAGVSLTGNKTFGYGTSMGAIYLTGNNGSYSARLHSNANYTNANNIGSVFATTHLNSYLLNTSNFSRVAKITNIVYNGENQPLTLTLDTDLGELTNAVYAIENVAGTKSFNGGSFGNTGQNSSVIGLNNFNIGNSSNILGSVNANTAGTATVLGYLNKNNGSNSNVFGSLNNNSGVYGNVIGLQNTNSGQYANIVGRNNNNKCASTNILGIANIVNETTYPSSILGFENNADATTQQFTLGYQNHGTRGQYAAGNVSASFMFGHNLTTSSGCYAIGKYNKDYDVQDVAKQNFFVVGQGDSTRALNNLEVKNNGNWYVYGVGGFDGTNSDSASIKSLQTVISDIQTSLSSSSSSSQPKYIAYSTGQGYSIGDTTTASGENSFAEGNRTTASGEFSHAEGSNTTASGQSSHAEGNGYYTYAYVHSAYTAGDTTIILEKRVYPGQYLSRRQNERYDAVKVSGVYSYSSNPGIFEVSLEEGFSANLAYHNYVYIFGGALSYESHAEGEGCTAEGSGSHAEGIGTTAFGLGAHSEGDETLAYGSYAHAEGKETLAYGDYSHTEGSETNAREGGHSEGNKTYAYGDYSHAEGHQTLAYVNYSHAEGKGYDKTVTVGSNYVARQTTIDLLSPVTPGQFLAITDNINKYRHGEMELIKILGCQEDTNNLGHYIVTLQYGMNNSVNAGDTLHIYSAASGSYSHSEGNNTSASGDNSHAEGDHTSASGESSHTEGKCTQTTNEAEHASGKYNQSTSSVTQFSVGVGADAEHRANAFEIDVNGNVYIKGIGTYDGTNIGQNGVKSVQQVIADLTQQIAALSNN